VGFGAFVTYGPRSARQVAITWGGTSGTGCLKTVLLCERVIVADGNLHEAGTRARGQARDLATLPRGTAAPEWDAVEGVV